MDYSRLNNHVNNALLLNGAVTDQSDVSTRAANPLPLAADTLLLGDSTQADTGTPLKVRMDHLLLQSQRDGTQRWGGTAGGTVNAITITTSPASSGAYVAGEVVRFKTSGANNGAVTLNVDGRGVANVYSAAVAALVAGDLPSGAVVTAVYDGTQFQVAAVLAAKEVDSLRCAEALRGSVQQWGGASGGTSTAITIAPTDSAGNAAFTAVVAGLRVTWKATNANGVSPTLQVNATAAKPLVTVGGSAVASGQIATGQFVECLYDGNNWVVLSGLNSGWGYTSANTTVPTSGNLTAFAHGLGVIPSRVRVVVVQTDGSAHNGYATNDEVPIESLYNGNNSPVFNIVADATNITVLRNGASSAIDMVPKGGGSGSDQSSTFDASHYFKLKVYASA